MKIQTVTEELAEGYGVNVSTGALVASVTPHGPAAKAGILEGDVILKFDGRSVTRMRSLPRLIARTPPERSVEIEIVREGQRKNLSVAVGRLAEH